MTIKCERCGQIVKVAGRIWRYRLSYSRKGRDGHYRGWHCDSCADAIERGSDY